MPVIAALALWQTEHRVSARTVVEGSTQIAAVAPFDGFVAEGLVRAGDTPRCHWRVQGRPVAAAIGPGAEGGTWELVATVRRPADAKDRLYVYRAARP
mgnify:CR=1 FL=1